MNASKSKGAHANMGLISGNTVREKKVKKESDKTDDKSCGKKQAVKVKSLVKSQRCYQKKEKKKNTKDAWVFY